MSELDPPQQGTPAPGVSIFHFESFGAYLAAYAAARRKTDRAFSWRWLAKRLQLKSHTPLVDVVSGRRLPTAVLIAGVCRTLKLPDDEALYAKTLGAFEAAETASERSYYADKLAALRRSDPAVLLELESVQALAEWHHIAILAMLDLREFRADPAWVAARLGGAITPEVARLSLARLERLGLVESDGTHIRATAKSFTTPHNLPSSTIRMFHKDMLALAAQAIDRQAVERRCFLGHTMAIDAARLPELQDLLLEFRKKLQRLAQVERDGSEVYHFAMQLFAVTEPVER